MDTHAYTCKHTCMSVYACCTYARTIDPPLESAGTYSKTPRGNPR